MRQVAMQWILVCGLVACGGKKGDPAPTPPVEAVAAEVAADEAPPTPAEPAPAPDVAPSTDKVFCGGIAGILCPKGQRCVDDPDDACDPAIGADCGGMCVPDGGGSEAEGNQVPACPDTETHRYFADLETCKRIRFQCPEGQHVFGDDCGCGCTTVAPPK